MNRDQIASFMGAWIEIGIWTVTEPIVKIASFMGAWIEICIPSI